jgi:cbb3-type cytochrome oxidase maturation protein
MDVLVFLIPIALFLGGIGLAAFIWSLKSGQFEDLDGAAMRILNDDEQSDTKPGQDAPKDLGTVKSNKS